MDSKLANLISVVTQKTEQGKLAWKAFGSESFRVRVGDGNLHLQRAFVPVDETDSGQVNLYSIQVTDNLGRVVADATVNDRESIVDLDLLERLFTVARSSALGGYQVIDTMLKALETIP